MADQKQEVEEEDSSGGPMAERYPAEPIENFDIGDIVERDVKQGREVKVKDSNGEWYAGEWVRKRMEATKDFPTQPTWAGYTTADLLKGVTEVPIEFNSLFRHIAIYGTTGYGKSTLLKNLMIQWAHAGYGFVYIDPKGDDVYELMEMLPEDRLDDVIWIEPGSTTHDKVVGINFLEAGLDPDDDGFENEVNSIIDDLEDILRSESYWGPTMSAIIQNVGGWMVRQEEDFCMLDLYMLLSNEEEREKFADNVEDEVIKQYARQVSNKGQDEIDALLKRIQKWVESPVTREIVAHRQSTINLTQAVEEGKIILVRSASVDRKDIKRAVATGIIRRVWSAIKSRESIPKNEREPFFMVVDEFDDVASEDADIDKMLSKARSYRLGIVLANQQPHQLPKSLVSSIMGNCDNILSMNPGNPDDARLITKRLDSIKDRDVLNLGRFKIYARISVDAKKSSPFPMSTFAPYPPRRSREAVLDKIDEILDEYGVEPMTHQMETEHILDRVGEDKDSGEGGGSEASPTGSNVETVETEDGNEITERQFFEAAFAAHIEKGSINEWVQLDDLEEQVEKKYGEIEYGAFDNMLEGIPRKYIERKMSGGEAFLRLTGEGERIAFQQDTGKSGSGGKFEHRLLLTRSYEVFQRLGAIVTLPEQEGKDQPDGLARPPINPFEQANSSLEEDRLREELKEKHPRLVELFGYDTLAIEAESKTRTKPMQPLKNLSKAVRRGQTCVFVVESGTKKHGDFAHHAKTVDRILSRPPFVSSIQEKNGSKRRVFYNTGRKVELRGGGRALRKDKGNCVWTEDGEKIILENSEGDAIAEFTDKEEVNDPGREKFKYHYEYDRGESAMIVKDKDGNRVDSYSATEDKSARQRMLADGYSMVYQPFIPELEFPHGKLPKEDQWRIVVIPDDDEDEVPQLFKDGELTPLLELEAELERDSEIKSQQESQAEDEEELEQQASKTQSETEDEEPEVASSSPKSNTDHIKDSDEVWTKPEPGDDDYDPTKDNSNYRTGYDEEYASDDWTGGDARDEEDFDDYVPPSERKDKQDDESESDSLNEAAVEGMMENDGRPPDFKDDRGKSSEETEEKSDKEKSKPSKAKRGGKRSKSKKRKSRKRSSKRGGKRSSSSNKDEKEETEEETETQTETEETQTETEPEPEETDDDDEDDDDPLDFQV